MKVRLLPGEHSQQNCQAARVQAGGGSVHVWGAKSLLVLPDRNANGMVYRDILRDTMILFARQQFGDNFRYRDDNIMPHRSRVVTYYLQQEDITKMDEPAQSPGCKPIEHLWDELGRAINNMDHPHITSMNFAWPRRISGPISMWNTISVWWPACPGE